MGAPVAKIESYIWFEKYRPNTLKELSLSKEHRAAFNSFIKDKQVPHLLLEGPQGSGKTTVAQILTKEIPSVVLSLNASGEDRGIATVKGKIQRFSSHQPKKDHIKIVFLDEADAITPDAQNALKNTMELYNKSCRFILTCNHVDKINPPIQSRCMKFTFDRFPKRKLVLLCEKILEKEGIENITQDDVSEIIKRFYPDIRSVINNLQAACISGSFNAKAIGLLNADPKLTTDHILSGSIFSIRSQIAGTTDFMYLYRYMFDEFIANNGNDEQKGEIALAVAEALAHDSTVPDREINFIACCINTMYALEISPNFSK